jgi:hypothetical protein
MKSITCLLLLILISRQLSGQLHAYAGNDTILCSSPWDTVKIGGKPAAWGGEEPYTYIWSTHTKTGSLNWSASHFLDDTTKANPKLINPSNKPLKFKLEVRDNKGATREDSILVRFSRFKSLALDFYANIQSGDTVQLQHDILFGIPPLRYQWSPNYHISNTSVSSPRAWPDTNTMYKVIVTDSIGCVSWPSLFDVRIRPSGVPEYSAFKSVIYPNPVDNSSAIYFHFPSPATLILKVLDSSGKLVLTDKFLNESYPIGEKNIKSGSYYYFIGVGSKTLTNGQFIKP